MKRMLHTILGLLLAVTVASPALALTAGQSYTVQLATVSASGQMTAVEQMDATADSSGRLQFQFSQVPDSSTAPFLMVQIMDNSGSQPQVVRQTLMPAPASGAQLQMGVNQTTSVQSRASLRAMQDTASAGLSNLGAMLPLTMISSGAMSDTDADQFGQAAGEAAQAFHDYLMNNGVTAAQFAAFQSGLAEAMQAYAADCQQVADQTDPTTGAGLYGRAASQLMTAMIQAGTAAGIDPDLISSAFDQAGQAVDSSSALAGVPSDALDAMRATMLIGAQQRHQLAQMRHYAIAMPVVGASSAQTQTYNTAMTTYLGAMITARQNFCQQLFADPTTLPDPTTVSQALTDMETAMQNGFDGFVTATTATDQQISGMLDVMAGGMNGGGMMGGGGMMSGSSLSQMGYGMMTTGLDGTTSNWSIMMVAAGNLPANVPAMTYTPVTADLVSQLDPANVPTAPDWSQLPDDAYKSMLQMQYDLMLAHLIDLQTAATWSSPPTQDELAAFSAQHISNRQLIRQGLQGMTTLQTGAMLAALSQPQMF